MKNTLKVLGIIALVVVIGFGVAACKNGDDDDNNKNNNNNNNNQTGGDKLPDGAVTGITVDAALVGTWKDATNGTLVFTSTGVGSPDGLTTFAGGFVYSLAAVKAYNMGTIAISGGKVTWSMADEELFVYKIEGTTLKIDEDSFVGTKQ